MKRIIRACLFTASCLVSGSALAAPCAGFTDVDDSEYGTGPGSVCGAVEWLKNRSITIGCTSPTEYCPVSPVTRASMALFMQRLGGRLTPQRFFVDQNPGPVTIQGTHGFVCQSPPVVVGPPNDLGWPRTAVLHGLVWGLVSAPVTWTADIWYSVDGGAIFSSITNFIPQNAATGAGMTQGATFAFKELSVGSTYVFAIALRESPDVTSGTGNFTDAACHLMVEIGNRDSSTPPFDPKTRPTSLGLLGANHYP
jgi:hypothetical protein